MSEIRMSKEEETIKSYEKLAKENQQKLQEIQENALPPIISEKVQKKIAKTVKSVIAAGIVASPFTLAACAKEVPVVEEKQNEEKGQVAIPSETIETTPPTTAVETITPETIKKVDAPEIKGQTFNLTFNQEDKTYLNEAGKVVGVWIEDAVKIEGKLGPAIVLNAETLNKILAENKEKGIFECPWPFDFQKDKGIEIVELFNNPLYEQTVFKNQGFYLPNFIGIKYSEPIDFYAPFDIGKSMGHITENIPDQKGPDFFSAQPWKNLSFGNKSFGGLQYNFIDWKPGVELSKAEMVGNDDAYLQSILEGVKCGDFLGEILPNTPDFTFLDFVNNKEFYENPGQFQGRLVISAVSDDFSKKISSLERTLRYLNKTGQEVPVGVLSEENTAYEQ